jgi:AcrR family transcriptional regulator
MTVVIFISLYNPTYLNSIGRLENYMNVNKKRPIKTKGEKTKQRIFESAARLFCQYGFDDVSVDAIVEAAGVSKGTFYIYFESKDALIAFFLADYVNTVDADYKAHLNSIPPEAPACDMLLSLVAKIADVLTDTIGCQKMKIVYKVQLTGTIDMAAVMGYDRELYKIFADVLELGIKRGEFHTTLSLDELIKHLIMTLRGLSYEWCIRYPDFDLKKEALTHFRLLLVGIGAKIDR